MGMMFSLSHPLSASPLLAQKRNNTPIIMPYKAKPKPLYNYKFKLCALLCSLKHSPFSLFFLLWSLERYIFNRPEIRREPATVIVCPSSGVANSVLSDRERASCVALLASSIKDTKILCMYVELFSVSRYVHTYRTPLDCYIRFEDIRVFSFGLSFFLVCILCASLAFYFTYLYRLIECRSIIDR